MRNSVVGVRRATSAEDLGFIDHMRSKKAAVARVYLPPDANTLLSTIDHCLRSRNYINVVVAGKQPALDYLSVEQAVLHCARGLGIWEWASNDDGGLPDVVMACAGDTPDRPVVFAFHGYPALIHRLTYRRANHHNIHVRGYNEEGTTTTPFDIVMMNDLDRFHLVMDVIDRLPALQARAAHLRQEMVDNRARACG